RYDLTHAPSPAPSYLPIHYKTLRGATQAPKFEECVTFRMRRRSRQGYICPSPGGYARAAFNSSSKINDSARFDAHAARYIGYGRAVRPTARTIPRKERISC